MVELLIGIVVGAAATGGAQFVLERRQESRAARAAERLLWNDLRRGRAMLGVAVGGGGWWARPDFELPTNGWEQFREALARELDPAAWQRIAEAFSEFEDLNRFVAALERRGELAKVPPPVPLLRPAFDAANAALERVSDLTGLLPPGADTAPGA